MSIVEIDGAAERSRLCEVVLRALPEWFGIEEAILHYVDEVAGLPTFEVGEDALLALKLHTPLAAEIYVMGVRPELHRQRLGTQLVTAAETYLRARNVELLQVKTLGPSRADEHYERTRRFYESCGFTPLEEIHGLWGEDNPCLLMVKSL